MLLGCSDGRLQQWILGAMAFCKRLVGYQLHFLRKVLAVSVVICVCWSTSERKGRPWQPVIKISPTHTLNGSIASCRSSSGQNKVQFYMNRICDPATKNTSDARQKEGDVRAGAFAGNINSQDHYPRPFGRSQGEEFR